MAGDGGCCNMTGVERRYHSLRAHLDELGFRQPLAIECVPLVEALFGDLVHTTSSLENYKKQAQELDEQVRVLNKGVQPFRADNERLVRQITELNKQINLIKEEAQASVAEAKARCRKLEHENADLQFLVSQHLSRIRILEVESAEKSKKLLSLQSAPSISIGKKKSGPNSQTKVEILSSIGPSKKQPPGRPWPEVFSGALTQTEDPFVVNMVDRSQAELRACRYEMKLLREESEKLKETISFLKQQVRDRDLDIAKLHTQVENNRCHPSTRDPEILKDDYTIANLRATIVSLEDSNNNLRTQLQDALRKQHEAMMRAVHLAERNQVLTNEIRNVDNVAMRVEDSCNHTVKETSQRIIELQEQLSHYQKMVADLERSGIEARCNAQNLAIDLEKLKLENKQLLETQHFRNTQNHIQTERVELSKQQHIEKELTKEIENLVAAVTYQKQKIAELEEKVALHTVDNSATAGASRPRAGSVSGNGSGSATSKGSSNSSSGRSGITTKQLHISHPDIVLITPNSQQAWPSRKSNLGVGFNSGTGSRDQRHNQKDSIYIDVESSLSQHSSHSASEPVSVALQSPVSISQRASDFTTSSGKTKSTLSTVLSIEHATVSTEDPTPTSYTTSTVDAPPQIENEEETVKDHGWTSAERYPRSEPESIHPRMENTNTLQVPRGRMPRQLTTISSLTADWELHSRPHLVLRHMATSPEFLSMSANAAPSGGASASQHDSDSSRSDNASSSGDSSRSDTVDKSCSPSSTGESDDTTGQRARSRSAESRRKKKQSAAKKAASHAAPSKNTHTDIVKTRQSNRTTGIQTDMKRIDSKETQVNLQHEPPERERAGGERYEEKEYRKEKRRDYKSKREEEMEEYVSERFKEEGQDRLSQDSRKDMERRTRDKNRNKDEQASCRTQPPQKIDKGSQSDEIGVSKPSGGQNHHHHHPCLDGAGDGPWNVKTPPDLCPIIKTLEAERNFFEKEYLRIREYLDNLPEKPGSTDLLWKLREAHAELDLLRAENHRLSKEVNDLSAIYKCEAADSRSQSDANLALAEKYTKIQQRLVEKERELLLVCEENHSLLTERDSLRLLAQRESQECERLSNDIRSLQLEIDLLRSKKSVDLEKDRLIEENRSLQVEIGVLRGQKEGEKTLDRELERERERLVEENRRLRETIETLKTSTMFNSSEKMCYDQPPQSVMEVLRRLERDGFAARDDVQRMTAERNATREHMQVPFVSNKPAVVDALHSTQKRVWELEADGRDASRTFDREVLELRSQLSARTKQLDAATLQSEAARTRLAELQNSLAQANSNHMKMKVLLEETERSLEQTQNDLSRLQTDSIHQQERIQKLEYDRAALEKEVNALRSEVQRLHSSINELENEKDELIRTADERAEQVQMLSEDVRQRDNRIRQLEKAVQDLQYSAE
ncbi:Centrosomal protein of 135 kDa [Frankliniella fusca]|uniref:Centrosomal protein of 135 kDa n=1 Tax=Frankliniella fusca TaxID=407009 RepID=A0AAE1HKZ8_9NEOP|nr:Centrosomal protein of 135 kDa [Frankliniella fusca]